MLGGTEPKSVSHAWVRATLRHLLDLARADFPNNPTLSMRNSELYMARFENTAEYMAASVGETINTALVTAVAGSEAQFENFLGKLHRKDNPWKVWA